MSVHSPFPGLHAPSGPTPESLWPRPVARLRDLRRDDGGTRPHAAGETIREDYFGHARLRGRVALVAGACSDVGRAIVAHFAREGAKIVVVYPSDAAVARECEWLATSEGSDCFLVRSRLHDGPTCNDVIARVIEYFGHLDVVVNCIDRPCNNTTRGLANHPATTADRLSRAALPCMASRGSIINTVASVRVTGATDTHATNDARAKDEPAVPMRASVRVLAQAAAAHRVRVNEVTTGARPGLPGASSAGAPLPGRLQPTSQAAQPIERPGQPADLGPACVFLASDDAEFITGQTLHIADRQCGEALLAG